MFTGNFSYAIAANREYLAPQIRSMNNQFHSEAKLSWSYDYPLANHIARNKSSANREMSLFSRLYLSFGYLWKVFPPRGFKCTPYYTKVLEVVFSNDIVLVQKLRSPMHIFVSGLCGRRLEPLRLPDCARCHNDKKLYQAAVLWNKLDNSYKAFIDFNFNKGLQTQGEPSYSCFSWCNQ